MIGRGKKATARFVLPVRRTAACGTRSAVSAWSSRASLSAAMVLIAALACLGSGCRRRTVEQHCNARQDVWEAAYAKKRPQLAAQIRNLFVKTCIKRFQDERTRDEFVCHDKCLDDVPAGLEPGSEAAEKAYKALQRCEAKCPGQYCIAPPTF